MYGSKGGQKYARWTSFSASATRSTSLMSATVISAPCAFKCTLRPSSFVYQGADRVSGLQQFGNDYAARFSGCASHDDSWLSHDRLLLVHVKCLIAVQCR